MKKKLLLISIILTFAIPILSGCFEGEEEVAQPNPQEEYNKTFEYAINESNKLLDRYSSNLDKLYIDEYTPEQFGVIVREVIGTSNDIVTKVDRTDASKEMFEFHQKVLTYLQNQHNLFLSSISQANAAKNNQQITLDKQNLRNSYMEVKTEQSNLLKQWKEMSGLSVELNNSVEQAQ
ncbi:hypothetical protein [Pseudobacillus badius]|uniref:hypothetical protein n=1 Tax=Bacillus badius TaxID=1455 RepID=UPI003D331416